MTGTSDSSAGGPLGASVPDAAANLARFRELVRERVDLQEKLRDLPDDEALIGETLRLGKLNDLPTDRGAVETALREERRWWLERWIR